MSHSFQIPAHMRQHDLTCHSRVLWSWKSDPEGHPDPDRFHLTIVAHLVKLFMESSCGTKVDFDDVAMFWDFGSLHQHPRDDIQKELFMKGLAASNIWYASTKSVVWTGA